MTLVEWNDSLRTGNPAVDYEHETLIGQINLLHEGLHTGESKETVADFLGELYARIAAHFALEEGVMRARRYDGYAEHKADHERLLDEIRDIMDLYEADHFFRYEEKLSARLDEWFSVHFRTLDARLHRYFS